MNYKDIVEKFDRIDTAQISDASLRQQAEKLKAKRKQGGFTLLELLVVVTILAIIGGAMISSFGGQEDKATRGVATDVIAGVENAVRIYQASTGALPNNMESLACAPFAAAADASQITAVNNDPSPDTGATTTAAYKFGGLSNAPGIGGGLKASTAAKFDLYALNADGAAALIDAGVTQMRYAVTAACDNDASTVESVTAFGQTSDLGAGSLVTLDIVNQAFEDPRPDGSGGWKNRGRGFSMNIAAGVPVMVWDRGTGGYNNVKVGGGANDVLIGMGIGMASDLVGNGDNAAFGKAPFYGESAKDKYAHYIALVKIGEDDDAIPFEATETGTAQTYLKDGKVEVVAAVDAHGDFLDEELAEFRGQKD